MKRFFLIVAMPAVFAAGVLVGGRFWPLFDAATAPTMEAADTAEGPLFYRHPMNPAITSPVPAKDDMGMDYIPVYADAEDAAMVKISPVLVNNLGVRTERVERSTLARPIETVGYIDYDERHISHVHVRTEGWIEDLRVRALGDRVRKGELLFEVYSPQLVNAQEEYLQVLRAGQGRLHASARSRLLALGISESQIRQLERERRALQLSRVYARQDGVVAQLHIREGMYVRPDTELITLADLFSIWVLVDVFERQADWLAVGQRAEVRIPYLPGEVWEGEVEYIYPDLDPVTRTLKVRLRFDNPSGRLKPNMYTHVTIHSDPRGQALSIPREALIRSGGTERVIVAQGEGRYNAVEVQSGIESGDRIEILSGLNEGDEVVVSAQFLIDSEASLKAALRRMMAPEEPAADKPLIWANGVVNAIHVDARRLNLTHDPIPELGWPVMTMDFQVVDTVDLDQLKPGMAVSFELDQAADGSHVITRIVSKGDRP